MQTKTKWMAAGTAAVLLALLGWAFAPRPTLVEVAEAKPGLFEAGIEEDGKTRVLDRYQVSAPLAGRWLRPTLKEGDTVQAGAVLGQLQPTLSPLLDARSVAELSARADGAAAAQPRAAARLGAAQVALAQAEHGLRRAESLAAQGFVSKANLDDAQLALQAAQQERASAQAEAQIARYELAQARAALGAHNAGPGQGSARNFELRAPVGGQVLRVQQPSEAMVAMGTPLIELGDTARLEVVAELLSSDALQLKAGQAVRIERWGGPGTLAGQVSRVEPGAFTKVSALGVEEQRVRVQIALTSPLAQRQGLGDGYRVAVKVMTRRQEGVLLVPVSAVFPLPGAEPGRHAVFKIDGGCARLSEVQLEARNSQVAWIAKGLDTGTTVVVYPPQGLTDGARVKAR
ncbi:efflux RND transporter periplasmic adaptor subunit [Roseateles sp.]|jgi:HlyD family secretion protein|uniref:efflux RND transporter periplasmic adaptor subunit n=1 Tax=Roseateles sp. TaxID=1971397 RepID=UPI0037C66A27